MISGFSQHALGQLQDALGGGGSVTTVVIDFERLASEVARLSTSASVIATAVMNPTWAAGDEMCRRAATALENEWFDEAAGDAQRSIDAYPYRAAPHLFLAIGQLHRGDTVAAYQALLKAIEFGKAAEPEHAATAGLLGASLAAAAGRADDAAAVLLKARESTKSRCPELVVATQETRPSSSAELCQLLKDDPAAWADTSAPDSLFGREGEEIRSAFEELIASAVALVTAAEAFTSRAAQLTAEDVDFLARLSTGGAMRYSGPIDAFSQYREGGCASLLKPFVQSAADAADGMPLAVAVHVGHVLVRYMSWRIPTRMALGAGFDEPFDLDQSREYMRTFEGPDVIGNGPVRDILVTDWFTIDRDVRLHDRPRMIGQAEGTGPYLRTLRAHDKYQKDAQDLRGTEASLAGQPRPGGFRRRDEQRWYDENQLKLAKIQRYLGIPPPDPGPFRLAAAQWLNVTQSEGEPVIRPYAHLSAPI